MRISDWSSDVCSSDLAGVAFDPDNGSLHAHMQVYLRDCRERLEQRQRLLSTNKPWAQLLTKLLIGDLAVRFRYFFLAGDFDYPTQQEAAAAFRSEEHTSELQSLMRIPYAVFCLKKKNTLIHYTNPISS